MSIRRKQSQIAQLKNWKVKQETLRSVNIECARLEVTQYELAEKALDAFKLLAHRGELLLSSGPVGANSAAGVNAYWHRLLDAILNSQTEHAVMTIRTMLESLAASVALVEPMTSDETHALIKHWLESDSKEAARGRTRGKKIGPKPTQD